MLVDLDKKEIFADVLTRALVPVCVAAFKEKPPDGVQDKIIQTIETNKDDFIKRAEHFDHSKFISEIVPFIYWCLLKACGDETMLRPLEAVVSDVHIRGGVINIKPLESIYTDQTVGFYVEAVHDAIGKYCNIRTFGGLHGSADFSDVIVESLSRLFVDVSVLVVESTGEKNTKMIMLSDDDETYKKLKISPTDIEIVKKHGGVARFFVDANFILTLIRLDKRQFLNKDDAVMCLLKDYARVRFKQFN